MIPEFTYFIGITIAVFLSLLLLAKREKSSADWILMSWLGLVSIHILIFYIETFGIGYQYPHLLGLSLPLPVLHGAMLFLYVSKLTQSRLRVLKHPLIHLLPSLTMALLAIPFYILSGPEKVFVFENGGQGFEWYGLVQMIFIPTLGLGYVIWSLILIFRHRSRIQEEFSNTDRKNLHWLQYLSIGTGLIWLLTVFFYDEIIFLGAVGFVLFIGFFGINQVPIFSAVIEEKAEKGDGLGGSRKEGEREEAKQIMRVEPVERYAKSGLKEAESIRIFEDLNNLMEQETLFRKNSLTLTELASRLGTHPNYLSQVINAIEGKNFHQYINTLRVKDFISQAAQPESRNFTLFALALECGFNSKSTFNKYFKEYTGQTPSAYLKSING